MVTLPGLGGSQVGAINHIQIIPLPTVWECYFILFHFLFKFRERRLGSFRLVFPGIFLLSYFLLKHRDD